VTNPISRRKFLTSGAALAGSLTLARFAPQALAAEETVPVFSLDPEWGAAGCKGACHGCRACTRHGANKLFATEAGAKLNRAHPNCKCTVVVWGSLPISTWTKLFGPKAKPTRLTVDQRDAQVRVVLGIKTKVFVPLVRG